MTHAIACQARRTPATGVVLTPCQNVLSPGIVPENSPSKRLHLDSPLWKAFEPPVDRKVSVGRVAPEGPHRGPTPAASRPGDETGRALVLVGQPTAAGFFTTADWRTFFVRQKQRQDALSGGWPTDLAARRRPKSAPAGHPRSANGSSSVKNIGRSPYSSGWPTERDTAQRHATCGEWRSASVGAQIQILVGQRLAASLKPARGELRELKVENVKNRISLMDLCYDLR